MASPEEALVVELLENGPKPIGFGGFWDSSRCPGIYGGCQASTRVVFASPGYESKRPPGRYSEQYFGHNCGLNCNSGQRALQIVLFSLLEAPN